jgi:predicted nucleotidyltransferase
MEAYLRGARARLDDQQRKVRRCHADAWSVARAAARLLKEQFGATRVVAFGSLVDAERFGLRSDIDLAAEGIPTGEFWRAWCELDYLTDQFEIELVALETASPGLRDQIAMHGAEL